MSTEEVNKILSKIHKYKSSHPVLSELWTTFILQRQHKLYKSIQDCENILPHFDDIKDLHPSIILFILLFLKQSSQNKTDIASINT